MKFKFPSLYFLVHGRGSSEPFWFIKKCLLVSEDQTQKVLHRAGIIFSKFSFGLQIQIFPSIWHHSNIKLIPKTWALLSGKIQDSRIFNPYIRPKSFKGRFFKTSSGNWHWDVKNIKVHQRYSWKCVED